MRLAVLVYVAGVLVGLWRTDAPSWRRAGLAILWPIGLLAAAITTPVLLAAAAIRFPLFGVAVAVCAVLGWWLTG